jgi:hypothetical protein
MQTKKQKCTKTKCDNYVSDILNERKKMLPFLRKTLKKSKKAMSDPKLSKEQINGIKKSYKAFFKLQQNILSEKNTKKLASSTRKYCETSFCNPGCKGTIFESGSGLPIAMKKKYNKTTQLKNLEEHRNDIFGKKNDVLVDDFYDGLSPKIIKKLRKEGAVSGCITASF